ncbi:ABC transporter ATP-binding protein [Vineibacter terrae]|uniref:ABC transporter ATP-binding protein n=1 Tax=Vineibacter terrae TaxID=2586908 RepID=A0A5C8PP87_9HYPH|nr:ABC transporter ATP-binding protein [Vineibacter terrae]TXL76033.1 ABC transporter ATP-binding protein [Vineibacter terrae]
MSQVDVELEAVVKRFGTFTAVDGIDLAIQRGQFVTLLGPSGCGKTTTLRMIGGFELPDSGRILVAGEPVAADRGAARPTRMVFQNYALFPHMTVAQNVAFGLRMQKVGKADIETRVQRIVALLGLEAHIAKFPRQMSGGQQQRVALARALVTQPRVLLLDEPLGALDLKMRKHMQNELKKLQRDVGITFVYVTHDQEEAMNLSDTIVVMDHGRIVQQGPAVEIYQNPATAYVADFIGEANLLAGTCCGGDGATAVAASALGPLRGLLPAAHRPAPGDPVLLSIRPEHVVVGTDAAALDFNHAGVLTETAYLGGTSRLTVTAAGIAVRADVSGHAMPAPGTTVTFGWAATDMRVLQHDDRFTTTGETTP